jgi:hypothetical protein
LVRNRVVRIQLDRFLKLLIGANQIPILPVSGKGQ